MRNYAFQITTDDIQIVARAHDVSLSDWESESVMDSLDLDEIENAALAHDDMDDQTNAAHAEIEAQMIAQNLHISGPAKLSP